MSERFPGRVVIVTGAGVEELRLKSGQYNIAATKDGKQVKQELNRRKKKLTATEKLKCKFLDVFESEEEIETQPEAEPETREVEDGLLLGGAQGLAHEPFVVHVLLQNEVEGENGEGGVGVEGTLLRGREKLVRQDFAQRFGNLLAGGLGARRQHPLDLP